MQVFLGISLSLVLVIVISACGSGISMFVDVRNLRKISSEKLSLKEAWKEIGFRPCCGAEIEQSDIIFVLYYIIHRGKCPNCGLPLDKRKFVFECVLDLILFVIAESILLIWLTGKV